MLKKFGLISFVLFAALGLWGCFSYYVEPLGLPQDPKYVVRGQELAQGLAACGFCHGAKPEPYSSLVGGRTFYDLYGQAQAANITPANNTGVGTWDTKSFLNYFRQNLDIDGEYRSPEFHKGAEWLSDQDLFSLVAYLATTTAYEHEVPKRSLSWWNRNITGFWQSPVVVWGMVPEVEKKNPAAYGRYLVDNVARCSSCHNGVAGWFSDAPYLEGGRELQFEDGYIEAPSLYSEKASKNAANIKANHWAEKDLVRYLKTGLTPSGRQVDKTACPVEFYANASDEDLQSISKYLTSLSTATEK